MEAPYCGSKRQDIQEIIMLNLAKITQNFTFNIK